jgi:hypothetical protein
VSGMVRASDRRGQVAITRFECRTLLRLLLVLAMHYRVKREVRRVANGFLGATTLIQWRQRTLLSISLWRELDGIYDMGKANRHISASRMPARLGVSTACGIYAYAGDWRQIMFATPVAANEPLFATRSTLTEAERSSP